MAERFADGLARKPERRDAYRAVVRKTYGLAVVAHALGKSAMEAAVRTSASAANRAASAAARHFPEPPVVAVPAREAIRRAERAKEGAVQAALLRDVFGNPFRPLAFDPRWRTADAVGVARGIYEDRAFDRLPLLADALMDAGCDDEQVIGHCRSDGPHVRGCWVVDLILGKN